MHLAYTCCLYLLTTWDMFLTLGSNLIVWYSCYECYCCCCLDMYPATRVFSFFVFVFSGLALCCRPSNVKVGSLVLPASTAAALGMPQDAAAQQPQTSPSIPPPGQSANQQQALAEKKRQLEAERERLLALKASYFYL